MGSTSGTAGLLFQGAEVARKPREVGP